jgi:hypothetical protein
MLRRNRGQRRAAGGRSCFVACNRDRCCCSRCPAAAQIIPAEESLSDLQPGKACSPYAERAFPDRVFWGLHTRLSADAGRFGNRLGLEEAYRFARGEQVMASSDQPRVLEIPTPRWVAYEAFRYGVPIPEEAEMTGQERAYTSPIWYSPAG